VGLDGATASMIIDWKYSFFLDIKQEKHYHCSGLCIHHLHVCSCAAGTFRPGMVFTCANDSDRGITVGVWDNRGFFHFSSADCSDLLLTALQHKLRAMLE
jgi:hypothetical protein